MSSPLSLLSLIQSLFISIHASSSPSIRFLVVGDIGGIPLLEVTTVQKHVANAMKSRSHGLESVINLGDNFYFTGVMDDNDTRFNTMFEQLYRETGVPWLTIAGNHDHFGNVEAQISYTKKSKLWYFPAPYYKQSYEKNNITIDILMLDTIELCGNSVDVQTGKLWDVLMNTIRNKWNGEKMKPKDEEKAEEQWRWIEKTMGESTADYLFVSGHYPIYSISSHGPTDCLVHRLDPLLKKYKATVYFSGHDHSLQHLQSSDGMTYIVSGAGSRSDDRIKNKDKISKMGVNTLWHYPPSSIWNIISQLGVNDGGFVELDVAKNRTTVLWYNKEGEVKYSSYLYPRWMEMSTDGLGMEIDGEL